MSGSPTARANKSIGGIFMLYIYKDKYGYIHISRVEKNAREYAVGDIIKVSSLNGRKLKPTEYCEKLLKKAAESLGV